MLHDPGTADKRSARLLSLRPDLCVVGGGLAGVCAAITAARAGIRVVLVQDRPVLGGNASSEVRLWILGATSHMGNNNRWAREGGVIDEILVENLYRNPEGNPVILDTILIEKVISEPNITLLLNTVVYDVMKDEPNDIHGVRAFCPQNQTAYSIEAPLFCDASGDGIVGFLAGAAFRMGAESRDEFGEGFAPSHEYGELLGHSLYFYTRDTERPVKFTPPSYALKDITRIPRYRELKVTDSGCRLWWIEYGGRLDTVHQTEEIKWELWKVAYGVWDYIKNSGNFPQAETLTLEWVGMIPGKRESRRFEGDYILMQQDLVEQRPHADAVSFGGWAVDLHPGDGVFSKLPACTQWHSKGVYQIPYRCLYSRNVRNLFLAGRIISASHVAFGSTRVMATCAASAQAVGMAAALCRRENLLPGDLMSPEQMTALQRDLMQVGQYIPGLHLEDPKDLARCARISATSRMILDRLKPCGRTRILEGSWAMLLPIASGRAPAVTFWVDATETTTLRFELRGNSRCGNFTPDVTLAVREIAVPAGRNQPLVCDFGVQVSHPQYLFYCVMGNPHVAVHLSEQRLTGVLACTHTLNRAVAKSATQSPPPGIGIDPFEFWLPQRRPGGENFAMAIEPGIDVFQPAAVVNGVARPVLQPNAWVAAWDDPSPVLTLEWNRPQRLREIVLSFDTDFDHPMESLLMGHPEREMPFCVKRYRLRGDGERVLYESRENHLTRNVIQFEDPVLTDTLNIEVKETHGAPAAILEVRCYGD